MNGFNDGKAQRISKAAARKMYEGGEEIGLCSCKMYPSLTGWRLLCRVNRNHRGVADYEGEDFDSMVLNYTTYNCTSETGSYPSFYKILGGAQHERD